MDPQTLTTLGIVGTVAAVIMGGGGIFAYRAMNKVGKRRFNPRQPQFFPQAEPLQQYAGRGPCPPTAAPGCVPAKVPADDNTPHAIYGLAQGDCCGAEGRLSQKQVQRLVDVMNRQYDVAKEDELFEMLSQLSAGRKKAAASK